MNKRNLVRKYYNEKIFSYYLSNMVYFAISFFVFILAFSFENFFINAFKYSIPIFLIETSIISYIILVIANFMMKLIYYFVVNFFNKYSKDVQLRYLGVEARMWIIINCCIFFIPLYFGSYKRVSILAISVISGKLFWVDNNKKNCIYLLKIFFSLPYCVYFFYTSLISYLLLSIFEKELYDKYLMFFIDTFFILSMMLVMKSSKQYSNFSKEIDSIFIQFSKEIDSIFMQYCKDILYSLKSFGEIWGEDACEVISKKSLIKWQKDDIIQQILLRIMIMKYKIKVRICNGKNGVLEINFVEINIKCNIKNDENIRLLSGKKFWNIL